MVDTNDQRLATEPNEIDEDLALSGSSLEELVELKFPQMRSHTSNMQTRNRTSKNANKLKLRSCYSFNESNEDSKC